MLYLLYRFLLWIGVDHESACFALPYSNLIIVVGIMHMIEGIMTVLSRHQYKEVIVAYKRNTLVGGYHVYRKWFIPLLLFYIRDFYIPILAILVYADDTYGAEPSRKTGIMGGYILGYGVVIALLGYMAFREFFPLQLAMMCMPVLHEQIFEVNRRVEGESDA